MQEQADDPHHQPGWIWCSLTPAGVVTDAWPHRSNVGRSLSEQPAIDEVFRGVIDTAWLAGETHRRNFWNGTVFETHAYRVGDILEVWWAEIAKISAGDLMTANRLSESLSRVWQALADAVGPPPFRPPSAWLPPVRLVPPGDSARTAAADPAAALLPPR